MGCILQCDNGMLSDGATLSDDDGCVWIIQKNLALSKKSSYNNTRTGRTKLVPL